MRGRDRPSSPSGCVAPRLLHPNFVATLLSDPFGIQARSGCFCAGPYLHRLYAIDDDWSARMKAECAREQHGAKLGFGADHGHLPDE